MVIAIEKGHDPIRNYLKQLGYEVVPLENPSGPVDAAVYENESLASLDFSPSCFGPASSSSAAGILLVNAKNRSPEEIAQILHQKAYGNLF